MNTQPETTEQGSIVSKAEKLLTAQMERCTGCSQNSAEANAMLLIAASYALQVARGDENISPPQIGVEAKSQSLRAAGIGFATLR